jgi:hypothetical protein
MFPQFNFYEELTSTNEIRDAIMKNLNSENVYYSDQKLL